MVAMATTGKCPKNGIFGTFYDLLPHFCGSTGNSYVWDYLVQGMMYLIRQKSYGDRILIFDYHGNQSAKIPKLHFGQFTVEKQTIPITFFQQK